MLGASQAVLLGCAVSVSATYDALVTSLAGVVSYWKFENDGTDLKGTAHATVTGTPELHVETIVDLDTIAEGASQDGECIAWPGTSGSYAEAPHHFKHKTAQGTIVVTFQHDRLSSKSTLLAADRSAGGIASGPGGLSIEITPEGAPRCFLRRQSDGAAVELLGAAADAEVGEAYSLVFKWGPGGLSMALWGDSGNLIRKVTNPLEDGLNGTSPIRFGAWHTGVSQHAGPYGRVVWLNRRLADSAEPILARARTISRPDTGAYTPFPFVTIPNPTIDHTGLTTRPPYSASDPRSTSFIDPMSGLEVFRITGNRGSTVFHDGDQDSGLKFASVLKPENNPRCQRGFNADGTLLMLSESKAKSADPTGVSLCRSALIDVDGSHGNSGPWRILRAGTDATLGDSIPATGWVWDWLNPLRAYVFKDDGCYEWWPVGGDGHDVSEQNKLFDWPSGFTDWSSPRGGRAQTSHDGLIYFAPVRRTSDGKWGGIRVNLATGATNAFVANPDSWNDDDDRGIISTGSLGVHGFFDWAGAGHPTAYNVNTITGVTVSTNTQATGHSDYVHVDGVEYQIGFRAGTWRLVNLATGAITHKASDSAGIEHVGTRNFLDTFERHGATGGSTSGVRYAMISITSPGSNAGIKGLRLGAGDNGVWRYLCNHRSIQGGDNSAEVHPHCSPDFEYVAFNSNWRLPGVETDNSHVNTYVCLVPDAWRSPSNDGS